MFKFPYEMPQQSVKFPLQTCFFSLKKQIKRNEIKSEKEIFSHHDHFQKNKNIHKIKKLIEKKTLLPT